MVFLLGYYQVRVNNLGTNVISVQDLLKDERQTPKYPEYILEVKIAEHRRLVAQEAETMLSTTRRACGL